jgi:triosephosphate isomerase
MKIIIANWKMNGDIDFAGKFVNEFNEIESENEIVICPSAALIYLFKNFRYDVGAQNCFFEEKGAFTGELSPKLLKDLGCKYVLLGHSERRAIFNESDDFIFKKWKTAMAHGLIPVVCIGEKLEDRNRWKEVLSTQLKHYLNIDLQGTIFAYEPVWSIGTGFVPMLEEIENVMGFIKTQIGNSYKYSSIYGGSVTASNASEILNCKNVDGVLVGGASLKIDEFKKIVDIII